MSIWKYSTDNYTIDTYWQWLVKDLSVTNTNMAYRLSNNYDITAAIIL